MPHTQTSSVRACPVTHPASAPVPRAPMAAPNTQTRAGPVGHLMEWSQATPPPYDRRDTQTRAGPVGDPVRWLQLFPPLNDRRDAQTRAVRACHPHWSSATGRPRSPRLQRTPARSFLRERPEHPPRRERSPGTLPLEACLPRGASRGPLSSATSQQSMPARRSSVAPASRHLLHHPSRNPAPIGRIRSLSCRSQTALPESHPPLAPTPPCRTMFACEPSRWPGRPPSLPSRAHDSPRTPRSTDPQPGSGA